MRSLFANTIRLTQTTFSRTHFYEDPLCWQSYLALFVCFFMAQKPPVGQGLLIHEVSMSHTTTRHIRYISSGRVIRASQRPLPDNTQQSQETDIHAPGGIRTHNLTWRAATDLHLRTRGHWDWLLSIAVKRKPKLKTCIVNDIAVEPQISQN